MAYVAITSYEKESQSCTGVVISDNDFEVINVLPQNTLQALLQYTLAQRLVPLNFGIDNGKIVEDFGAFSRFPKNRLNCGVVIAELKSVSGKLLGYRILSCANNQVVNMKIAEIVEKDSKQENPFLQNGVIRNNTVNCYSNKKYPVMILKKKPAQQVHQVQPQQQIRQQPKQAQQQVRPTQPQAQQARPQQSTGNKLSIDPNKLQTEQKREISKCVKAGVDPELIANPDLTTEQMKVLRISKKNGSLAEYYNNPAIPVDSMKFYADHLVDEEIAKECKPLLAHPELSVDELRELYMCVENGIPVDNLIGKTPNEIYCERKKETQSYWGNSRIFGENDEDYVDKASAVAQKIRGY